MQRFLRIGLAIAAVAAILFGARASGLDRFLSIGELRAHVESWGALGPAAFIGICIAGLLLYMPESLLLGAGGVLFGFWSGMLYGWIATVIGTTLTFLIVRYIAQDWARERVGARFEVFRRFDQRFADDGFRMVLLLRAVLFVFPPLNWALGATRVHFGAYVAGSALGILPCLALVVYFGGSLAEASASGDYLGAQVLIPAGLLLGVLVASGILGRRMLARPGS